MALGCPRPGTLLARVLHAGACAVACAAVWAPGAVAATASERPPLHIDRSDIGVSDGEWDELQEALRQTRLHAPATFAGAASELPHPTPVASDGCGASVATGDVNGDGRDDVLMGCTFDDTGGSAAGSVIVITRNATNTGYAAGIELNHPAAAADDNCGWSVASGDVNEDGRDDVLMGCHQDDGGAANAGSVVVITRNATNTGYDTGVVVSHPSPAGSDFCGSSVAAGDVNGDGRDDILMGCTGDDTGASAAGSVVVITRNAANTGYNAGIERNHPAPTANDNCGGAVAAGDVNADGHDDILMGCPFDDTGAADAGSVVVITRNATNTGYNAGIERNHPTPAASDQCGTSVAAGDANADGRDDILMGCPFDDTGAADAGSVVVITRNATNTGYNAGIERNHPTPAASDQCGTSVAAGDANADGRDDILMGCPFDDTGAADAGSVVVITRNATNTGYNAGIERNHPTPAASDQCGEGVAAGDVNADGRADVVTGCRLDDTGSADAGSAVVVDGTGALRELVHPVPTASDGCGRSVAVGDVNGDGLADVALGCYQDDTGGSAAGSVVVLTRNAANTGYDTGTELGHPVPTASDQCGWGLAVGDVNGDGRADVAMGCSGDDTGGSNTGSVVVITRNASNTGFDTGIELAHSAPVAGNACGRAVAVGDVNGDGNADVSMGCYFDDVGGSSAGSVVVLTRNAANTGFDTGIELRRPTPAATDWCGFSVAMGDVNGDGRADVAIGCSSTDVGGLSAGSVVVITRNATNTGFDAGVEIGHSTPVANAQCGASVALGDVNGDGRADVAMGCVGDDAIAAGAGSMVVLTRNAVNTGFDTGVRLDHPAPAANDGCGRSVAFGDVNGDGRADAALACGADDTGGADAGSVVVLTRNATNSGFDVGIERGHPTPVASDLCGWSVAMGDVHGDGRADVAMGCHLDEAGGTDLGSVVVLASTSGGTAGTIGTDQTGVVLRHPVPGFNDQCGISVATGDVNGDRRVDVMFGCQFDDTGASGSGTVVLYTRNAANSGYDAAVQLTHPVLAADDSCGYDVATGDVNDDGRDDILMGCYGDDTPVSGGGSVIVHIRNAANTGFDAGIELDHPAPAMNDLCGHAVAAGDVNADGRDDVVFGCRATDGSMGSAVVVTRNAANTGFDGGIELTHPVRAASDQCGYSVVVADIGADGRQDVVMGCPGDDTGASSSGSVVVVARNAANTGFVAGVDFTHADAGATAQCGQSVAAGDIDADGRIDLLLGCPFDDSAAADAGSGVVFLRNAANTGFDNGGEITHPAAATNDQCSSVFVGDTTGDGRPEVLLGCPYYNSVASNSGHLVVVSRNATNSGFDPAVTLGQPVVGTNDYCGREVVTADANGDGRADVVLSCFGDDSVVVFDDRSTLLETRRLNQRSGTISAVTVGLARVANGAAAPVLQASADGGTNWQNVTAGVSHTFAVPGTDLRLRIRMPQANTPQMTQTIHDLTLDYTYALPNSPPSTPPLVSPAAAGSTSDTTPDLVATFSDVDAADTGQLDVEVCTVAMAAGQTCVGAGGALVASGSSAAGIVNGADGTWTVTSALTAETTYHWHVRARDNAAAASGWSASRSLTIDAVITVSVDSATASLGTVLTGSDSTATSVVTVSSADATGYTLSATDESDAWGADCACGSQVVDWTGTDALPSTWTAGTEGGFGITVRDTTGVSDNRLAKWGPASAGGWPATDFANNRYAGLKLGAGTVLHDTTAVAASDTITVTYRVNVAASAGAGAYDSTIVYTALGKP